MSVTTKCVTLKPCCVNLPTIITLKKVIKCDYFITYITNNKTPYTNLVYYNSHFPCLRTSYTCNEHCSYPCFFQAMPSSPNTTTYQLILWKRSKMCMEARSVSPATLDVMERSSCLDRLFTTSPSYWVCSTMHVQVSMCGCNTVVKKSSKKKL